MAKHKSKRAKDKMNENQINEGMGSVNVEQEYDVSRIKKLAGLANSSTSTGTPVAEKIYSDIETDQAEALADELEQHLGELSRALETIEHLVRSRLPGDYRSMENYTFAHIKAALGGHGYAENRMSKSINTLIEDLREHGYEDEEE
jgi:hypothetical protein